MKLSIYSLKKILFAGQASLLNCKTVMGEVTILDNHEMYIGVLSPGVMRVVESNPSIDSAGSLQAGSGQGKEHFFEITSGFLEVRQGNQVRCMVE